MPSTSRRRVLWSTIGLFSVLAGCSADSTSSATATPTSRGPPADALVRPPTVSLRNPSTAPVVVRSDGENTTKSASESTDRTRRHILVADAKTATSITFADVEGTDRARRFLDDTDFATQTVYVEQREIGECYEQKLCWVRWTDTSVETAYASGYRDADTACTADANDVVAVLIRLPVALNPEGVHRHRSSAGSGRCRTPSSKGGNA